MKFRLFIICLIHCAFISTVLGPDYQYAYYFDKGLDPCKKTGAIVSSKWLWGGKLFKLGYLVNQMGLLLMPEHYTDPALDMPQGPFKSYSINARLEATLSIYYQSL